MFQAKKNEIPWNRNNYDTTEIKRVIIYRSIDGEPFQQIAERPASDSLFVDPISDPSSNSFSYKISAKQTCGPELFFTPSSELQSSINLNISIHPPGKRVLRWNLPNGFLVNKFRIYRGLDYSNLQILVDSLPGSINSYIDESSVGQDFLYRIESETNDDYLPWGRIMAAQRKTASNTKNSTFSVCDSCYLFKQNSLSEENSSLILFPNPTSGTIIIKGFEKMNGPLVIQVFSSQEVMVDKSELNDEKPLYTFPKSTRPGLYFIQVSQEKLIRRGRIVYSN